jgi:hypothetical protein
MPDLLPISLGDMIREVRREVARRQSINPQRRRTAGLALRNQIDRQYDVMEAVLKYLEEQHERRAATTVDRE